MVLTLHIQFDFFERHFNDDGNGFRLTGEGRTTYPPSRKRLVKGIMMNKELDFGFGRTNIFQVPFQGADNTPLVHKLSTTHARKHPSFVNIALEIGVFDVLHIIFPTSWCVAPGFS